MPAYRYRNKKTGKVATYSGRRPNLEASDRWERLDDDKKPAAKASGSKGG